MHEDGNHVQVRFQEELEFGLGGRFQLDLYARTNYESTGQTSALEIRGWSVELRWALANWGEIFGNPTIYLEYIVWNHSPTLDSDPAGSNVEPKLLFGGQIAEGWHWGLNLAHERTLGGKSHSVYESVASASVSYTLIDRWLSTGIAVQGVYEADRDFSNPDPDLRSTRTRELYIGPSFQIRMAPYETIYSYEKDGKTITERVHRTRAHLDIEPMIGIGPESKQAKIFLVLGWDF